MICKENSFASLGAVLGSPTVVLRDCPSDCNPNKFAPANCLLEIDMQVYMRCVSLVAAEVCKSLLHHLHAVRR